MSDKETSKSPADLLDNYWKSLIASDASKTDELKAALHRASLDNSATELADLLDEIYDVRDELRAASPPLPHWESGKVVGEYRILNVIGSGGMGTVYRAKQVSLNRIVALKTVRNPQTPDETSLQRFREEAAAAARLQHPNIVPVHEIGEFEGILFFSMDLIDGENLKQRISGRPMQARQAAGLLINVCKALECAHEQGILHRDLKPSNILIDQHGRPFVSDFGLARNLNKTQEGESFSRLIYSEAIAGTPSYLSPEQVQAGGGQGVATDVYGVGATLYEMLTGRPPFVGNSVWETLRQVVEREPVSPRLTNPEVPIDLETICLKCLAKDPHRRYESASLVRDDMSRFVNGLPVHARPTSRLQKTLRWCKRNRALSATLGLFLLALVAGTIGTSVMWWRSHLNAREANQLATDLQANRARLRDSVRQFQSQIFSDEALHWQMTEEFRSRMFQNVISYLDEFAQFESTETHPLDEANELTNDYLLVAQSALDVGSYDNALIAADRARERARKIADSEFANSDELYLHFEACRIAFFTLMVQLQYDLTADHEAEQSNRDKAQGLAIECHDVANRGAELSDQIRWSVAQANSRLMLALADPEADSSSTEQDFTWLQNLSLGPRQSSMKYRITDTTVKVGWLLASKAEPERQVEILTQNELSVYRFREVVRHHSKRNFAVADWMKGKNLAKRARAHSQLLDREKAIKDGFEARTWFGKAIEIGSHNRRWTEDAIENNLWLCRWLVEQEDFVNAARVLEESMRNMIRLLKSDIDNLVLRKRIVKSFVMNAELSKRLGLNDDARQEYYIAAQDCRYLIRDERTRDWAYPARLWLLSEVVSALETAPNEEFRNNFHQWEKKFPEILSGEYKPPRPDEFRFENILPGILNETSRER